MNNKKTSDYLPDMPVKPIKHILKKFYSGEISENACFYVRDILLQFTEILAYQAVKEFKESNDERSKYNIPKMKRLDKMSFIQVWERFYKIINDSNGGKVGKENNTLLCQDGAKKWRKEKKAPSKT